MRITSPRTTLAVGVIGLAVVAVASWLLLLGPVTGRLSETRADHAETVDANRLLAVRLHAVEKQRDELPATVAAADELATLFPATADQPGFFAMLGTAVREAGIDPARVTTLSPTVPVKLSDLTVDGGQAAAPGTADLAVQAVTVTVEASAEEIEALLAAIERLDRAFLVQSVGVTTDEKTTTGTIVGALFLAPPLEAPEAGR